METFEWINTMIGATPEGWESDKSNEHFEDGQGRKWTLVHYMDKAPNGDLAGHSCLEISTYGHCGNYTGHKRLFHYEQQSGQILTVSDGVPVDRKYAEIAISEAIAAPSYQQRIDEFEDSEGIDLTVFIGENQEDDWEFFISEWQKLSSHGLECYANVGQGDSLRNTVYQLRFTYAGSLFRFAKKWGERSK